MLRIVQGSVAVAAFCAAFVHAPPREDIAYVVVDRATLLGLADRSAPTLAEVLPGCAVRVVQRKDGMARIELEGWVAETSLGKEPPFPVARPDAPEVEPALEPVADLALAHHVEVVAAIEGAHDAARLVVALSMRTIKGRPVVVAGSKHAGHVIVYAQRRVAGQRARGDALLERDVTFSAGSSSVTFTAKELLVPDGIRELLVSARAELSDERELLGAAVDVPWSPR